MINIRKINIKMINIKRKHKIAVVIILLVLSLVLIVNSVLAPKPVLSVSSHTADKKSDKSNKPAGKKTKVADNNQVSDGNLTADTAEKSDSPVSSDTKSKESVKSSKPAIEKTKIVDGNHVSDSNLMADKTKKSVKSDKPAGRRIRIANNNQVLDSNRTASPAKDAAPLVLIDANGNVFVDVNGPADSNDKVVDNNEAFDPNQIIVKPNKPTDSNMPADGNTVADNNMPLAGAVPQIKSEPAELSANLGTVQSGIQSLVFMKNMPIIDALQLLAARYNKNIVSTPKVTGTLNFTRLNNVNFEEAMGAILGNEFKYRQQGNLVKVYSLKEYQGDEMVCKVFTLHYIAAAEAKKMIIPVMSSEGKIEITSAAQTGVPVDDKITAPSGGGDTIAINDMIVMYDYPDRIAKAEQIIAAIDIRPKQVLIEATILTATLTNGMQLGIDWDTLISRTGDIVEGLADLKRDTPTFLGFGGSSTAVGTLSGGMTIGVVRGNIATFIRAVEEITDVTILANPKILATNKQLGQVYIGTKIAYQSSTTQNQTGSTTQEVKFLDTGTKLSFRPYIGDDGYIRMDIHPKDSSAALRGSLPDETSAELVSNIIVKDGETIVIGGLFRNKVQTAKTQVPVLGNIPVIGAAFSSHADEVRREEVIVLLTPHIIEEPNQAEGAERADDVARKSMGAEDELHPTGRMKLAMEHYEKAAVYYVGGRNIDALKELKSAWNCIRIIWMRLRSKRRFIMKPTRRKSRSGKSSTRPSSRSRANGAESKGLLNAEASENQNQ